MLNDDTPNIIVAENIRIFSQALKPCLIKVEKTLSHMSNPALTAFTGFYESNQILQQAGVSLNHLNNLTQALMIEVISNPDVSIDMVYRHVGRFEGNLDLLLEACEQAVSIEDFGVPKAKTLLINGFNNILEQIRDWLQNICNAIDNPMDTYKTRNHEIENGSLVFSFYLDLKAPAEFSQLTHLIQNSAPTKTAQHGLGFWNSVCSIIAGVALADWMFNDD